MFCRSEKRGIIVLGMQKNDVLNAAHSGSEREEDSMREVVIP